MSTMPAARTSPPLGLVTLGDHLPDPRTGIRIPEDERFRQFVELGVVAEELGCASFHVGEHHFSEYALSSPTPVLAAVAERTTSVVLSTAVSLLPHHDPVRIAEDYATVDVLSGGRVEVIAGRGVYRDHYRQFGQDADTSESMLVEAVELLRRLWTEEGVSWRGTIRPPLDSVTVHPRPVQRPHPPIWLSSSSLTSAARAVELGCPIAIATISTGKELPNELARAYRRDWAAAGRDPADAQVILHVHCYVGPGSTADARERWHPHQTSYLQWVLDEVRGPGLSPPPPWSTFDQPDSQAVCGSVDDVAEELAARVRAIGGVDRLLIHGDQGGLAFDEVCASMARVAEEVAPRLTELLASEPVVA